MKKILILTASPLRDAPIDSLLASHLKKMDNEVWVKPCLREGRQAVLDLQPDVVVVPPIRNPYSRDFVETLKDWGCGVVSRHTEASCDWQDFKIMTDQEKMSILGGFPYIIDKEIVWGKDEQQILERRNMPFPVVSVGSLATDVYRDPELNTKYMTKEVLCEKHKLETSKRTILILSAWGFIDSSPDLGIDEQKAAIKDIEGRKIWLEMITSLNVKLKDKFNILVTLHPNIIPKFYADVLTPLGIPLDTNIHAVDLVKNCDIIVHAGSTTAFGAHILNKPAFQFGDQNQKMGWFGRSESPLSHISPYAKNIEQLISYIENCQFDKSNASEEALTGLETGRYGCMDGKATERAAEEINKINGKFKMKWPRAYRDYTQPMIWKSPEQFLKQAFCGVCGNRFGVLTPEFAKQFIDYIQKPNGVQFQVPLPIQCCPHCGTRIFINE